MRAREISTTPAVGPADGRLTFLAFSSATAGISAMKDAISEIAEYSGSLADSKSFLDSGDKNKDLEASSTTFLLLERFESDAGLNTVTVTRRRRVHIA